VLDPDPAPFGTLRAHIARANPLWRDNVPDVEPLVIFRGPDTYISPSWYATKRETAKVVPTWNYAVVHAHGAMRVIDDPAWLRGLVETLTNRHESTRQEPWQVTDAPSEFIDRQISAIIGLEISITRLYGKWKVSQNRPAQDQAGVVEGLVAEGREAANAMADLVRHVTHE
jgi:transcriptional regulator